MTAPDKPLPEAEQSEYLREITTMAEPKPLARVEPRAAVTPMQLLQAAVDSKADLAQLEKLMELQERWERNEARKAYVAALSAFKRSPPTIVKNRSASFGGAGKTQYDYATLAQVAGMIAPALSAHGLSHSWSMKQDETGIAVTCSLTHELGHSESITMRAQADTSGSKNSIQAIGSTVTYLERYTLLAITGLATSDQDDDGIKITEITPEQKEQLVELMREIPNLDTAAFLKYLGVAYLDMLPANQFDNAVAALEKKRRAAK